jgi:TonB family protein
MIRLAVLLCLLTGMGIGKDGSNFPRSEVTLVSLSNPIYPQLAKQARVAGDVELKVSIRPDGTVDSVDVIRGPGLLRQAALNSAQQSKFECRKCGEDVSSYELVYSFMLGPTNYCSGSVVKSDSTSTQTYPQVTRSQNHVTVLDQPLGSCDVATHTIGKVRSVKCLYLWKCGHR